MFNFIEWPSVAKIYFFVQENRPFFFFSPGLLHFYYFSVGEAFTFTALQVASVSWVLQNQSKKTVCVPQSLQCSSLCDHYLLLHKVT